MVGPFRKMEGEEVERWSPTSSVSWSPSMVPPDEFRVWFGTENGRSLSRYRRRAVDDTVRD